jgi:hypothetical protein
MRMAFSVLSVKFKVLSEGFLSFERPRVVRNIG